MRDGHCATLSSIPSGPSFSKGERLGRGYVGGTCVQTSQHALTNLVHGGRKALLLGYRLLPAWWKVAALAEHHEGQRAGNEVYVFCFL